MLQRPKIRPAPCDPGPRIHSWHRIQPQKTTQPVLYKSKLSLDLSLNTKTQPQNNSAQPNTNSQLNRQLLQRFDTNGDGRLSGDELQAARQARQQMQGNQRGGQAAERLLFSFGVRRNRLDSSKLMSEYDLNGDGELNAAERRSAIQALENK